MLNIVFAVSMVATAFADREFHLDEMDLQGMTSGWRRPGVRRSVDGAPLRVAGREYKRGVGTHACSNFIVDVGGKGVRFVSRIGIDDEVGDKGLAKFRVLGDGRLLYESPEMTGKSAPLDLDVDISGVRLLELDVDDLGDFGWDHSDWLEAKIVMKDGFEPKRFSGFTPAPVSSQGDFTKWAPTPPMGWNSWDCYGSFVNEPQFRANVDFLAANLRNYGYEYAVIDIRWTVQNESLTGYNQTNPVYTIDEWGRYVPAPNRFPSAGGGRGFKPLADWVHSKGLKFGIHIMRGVPKEAVARKMPVKGADGITCDKITNGAIECRWLRDNCTVVRSKRGAQEYYDSIFELYAGWGVDFVKVDDLSAPCYHLDEIEMIRRAIDKCGRKIVFSCSPGETPLQSARHVETQANMWRLVNDVWDTWGHLYRLMPITCEWLKVHSREGTYPDCDMIPLGKLCVTGYGSSVRSTDGRKCNLTRDEQRSLMSFFAIVRSPLMLGADLPQLRNDFETFALITDSTILAANRDGRNPKPLFWNKDAGAIISDNVRGGRFLGLFNLRNSAADVSAEGVTRHLPAHGCAIVVLEK